jgi:hypothetical protein
MHVRNSEMKSSVSFFFFEREKLSGSHAEQEKEKRTDDAGLAVCYTHRPFGRTDTGVEALGQ